MFVPLRGRAVAARRAHNPEVSGSNPLPATKSKPESFGLWFFISPAHSGRKISKIGGISYEPQRVLSAFTICERITVNASNKGAL
jgi:hypothetical protein